MVVTFHTADMKSLFLFFFYYKQEVLVVSLLELVRGVPLPRLEPLSPMWEDEEITAGLQALG